MCSKDVQLTFAGPGQYRLLHSSTAESDRPNVSPTGPYVSVFVYIKYVGQAPAPINGSSGPGPFLTEPADQNAPYRSVTSS